MASFKKCIYRLLPSTPLTYAICLNELGEKLVHKYQGRKPSGRMFNEIVLDNNSIIFYFYFDTFF